MAARIITVCNQKGGSGKTTTCMTLAAGLAARGWDVLVVDADPQGTATRWGSSAPEETPFPATVINLAAAKANLHRMVRDHVEKFDVVLLDCPPAVESPATQSALLISDLALVPVIPRPGELWALRYPGQHALHLLERRPGGHRGAGALHSETAYHGGTLH